MINTKSNTISYKNTVYSQSIISNFNKWHCKTHSKSTLYLLTLFDDNIKIINNSMDAVQKSLYNIILNKLAE